MPLVLPDDLVKLVAVGEALEAGDRGGVGGGSSRQVLTREKDEEDDEL